MPRRNLPAARRRVSRQRDTDAALRPISTEGIGRMVLADSAGNMVITPEAREWMTLDAARRAATRNVPDYPIWHQTDLPDGVVSDRYTGYAQVGWAALREFREQSPLLQAIHASRQRSAREHCQLWSGRRGDIGIRVMHESQMRAGQVAPKGFEQFVRMAEKLLDKPSLNSQCRSMDALIVPLVEDLLTINRPAIEVQSSLHDPNVVVGIKPVDGGLLLERAHYVRGWLTAKAAEDSVKGKEARRYLDRPDEADTFVATETKSDLVGQEYVLVRNGVVEGTYGPGRIFINPLVTRTDVKFSPYQPSAVEQALETIAAFWETWDREQKVFREGSWIDTLMFFSNIDPTDFHQLTQQFREAGQGYHRSRKPMFVRGVDGGDVKSVPIKEPPTEMQFQQRFVMTASLVFAVYQEHPSAAYFPEWQGGMRAPLSEHDRSDEVDNARSSGHKTDLRHICGQLTQVVRAVIHPELVVVPEFGEYDAMGEARLHDVRVKTTHTRNELRVEAGDPPIGAYLTPERYEAASDAEKVKHDQNPWNLPDSQVFMAQSAALSGAAVGDEAASDEGVAAQGRGNAGGPGSRGGSVQQERQGAVGAGPRSGDKTPGDPMQKGAAVMPLYVDDWQTYG